MGIEIGCILQTFVLAIMIVLGSPYYEAIAVYLYSRNIDHYIIPLIFTNRVGGYLPYRTVYGCFKRFMVEIGTTATRFHDLRHIYAVMAM